MSSDERGTEVPPEVELRNVTVAFGSDIILQNVSLKIEKSEKFVLVGPSGQGKTVLLKVMAGLLAPTEGELLIRGQDFHRCDQAAQRKIRLSMGMLFQKNALFDSLKVGENISFPLIETRGMTSSETEPLVQRFLDAVGILHAKDLYPDEMSGGMQKRLGIARALALDPEILFYDDPTAGLDPITSKKIIELIKELQSKKSATLIAITNDMNRAYQLADRIGCVFEKSVHVTGSSAETKSHPNAKVQQFIRGLAEGPLTHG